MSEMGEMSKALNSVVDKIKESHTLPVPVGYKVLVAMPEQPEKIGNVYIPDEHRDREATASIIGFVVDMGPECFNKSDAPYCKPGDFIVMRSYSGTRLQISGVNFRLINDDNVEAVVDDPRGVLRS